MPPIITKYVFSKLLTSPLLKESMQHLHAISGMDVLLLDDLGGTRLTVPRQPSVSFVQLMRADSETGRSFRKIRQATLTGNVRAHIGVHEIVYTISVEGAVAGYILLSAFRNHDPENRDLKITREIWRRRARAGLPVRWSEWFEAWSALPDLTQEQQHAWRETIALFMREVLQRIERRESDREQGLTAWPPLVQQTCERIREAYDTPLRLFVIAKEFGVSPEHLSRTFRQTTGLCFGEYLAEARIGAACEALSSSPTPISQIAHQSGFSSLSRFNRCFRKHRGITPRSWRKRARLQA